MRFTRIKVTEKAVELDWIEKLANGETKTIGLQSPNRPLPALLNALAAFRTYVADLLDLPSWAEELRVTTLNIDEGKDGRRGLIVTCVRPIEKASMRVLVLNTPRMGEGADGGEAKGFLPDEILTLVSKAEVCAGAFVNGEREQTELPLGVPTKPAEPSDDVSKRRRKKDFIPEVGYLAGSGATSVVSDENMRSRLKSRGRDVSLEAIGRWTSSERDAVVRWLDTLETIGTDEPAALMRDATPSLLDDLAQEASGTTKAGDDWTQEARPPKAADVEAVAP